MTQPSRVALALLASVAPAWATGQTATSLDARVQPPELAAPQRGSLAGQLATVVFGPADLSRGAASLPAPLAVPEERGALAAAIFPAYSPDAGISEWGMGWQTTLAITRTRVVGDLDFATDDLTGPWGRMLRGTDGYWYPVGLSKLVRLEVVGDVLTAWLADGSKLTFGGTERVDAPPRGTYAWYLTDVESVQGRRTHLTWQRNASGRLFLAAASYGGTGTDYQYAVTFTYEPTRAPFRDFRSGRELKLDQRVKTVIVSAKNQASGAMEERWRYDLTYREEGLGPAFFLETVQQAYRSGSQPPPTRYTHALSRDLLAQAALTPNARVTQLLASQGSNVFQADKSATLDADLDGRVDLELAYDQRLLRQSDAGFDVVPLAARPPDAVSLCRPVAASTNAPRNLVQLRASGDAYQVVSLGVYAGGTLTTLTVCNREGQSVGSQTLTGSWALSSTVRLVDVNRDRQPDLIRVGRGYYQVLPNASTATTYQFAPVRQGTLQMGFTPDTAWLQDVNGDGIADIVARYGSGLAVYYGRGNFEFEPVGQNYVLRGSTSNITDLSNYHLTFVDVNKDGLIDLVLTRAAGNTAFLLVNDGSAFVLSPLPGLGLVDSSTGKPFVGALSGTGNTELTYARLGEGRVLALDAPGTSLMATADDGKGTVLRFAYGRAAPSPGVRHRQAVLTRLTVESSGHDAIAYDFTYGTPRLHSAGKFLLGFDRVTRTDPLLTHDVDFLNEDRYAGIFLGSAKRDALVAGLEQFESRSFEEAVFQGIPWKRLREQTSGWRGTAAGAPPPVTETTTQLAWDRTFCPAKVRKVTASGALTTEKHYVDRPAFGMALACLADSIVETGAHADATFDFRHETALTLNDKGLVEKVESVSGLERLVLQTVGYTTEWRVQTVASPGKGSSSFDWPLGTHLLRKVTLPDGSTVEVADRDPLTDEIRTLRTTHGTVSFDKLFRFDGQERLWKQWDTLGAATETNPNLLVRSYQYATASVPGSIYASQLVEASGSARDAKDLVTAAGEAITTAARIPEGWSFASLVTRSRVRGETKGHLRPTVASTADPAAMDHAALLAGTSELERSVAGPFKVVTDHAKKFHADVERRVAESLALDPALVLVKKARENGTTDRTSTTDAGGKVLSFADEAKTTWRYRYDALGRLREVALPDGKKHRAGYDGHGRIWRVERDDVSTVEYDFAPLTSLLQEKRFYPPGATAALRKVTHAYDSIGRAKEELHAEGTATKRFTMFYDGATPASPAQKTTLGFLTGIAGDGFAKALDYWPDGKLKIRTLAALGWRKVETSFTYTESREVKQRTTRLLDVLDVPLSTTTEVLTYDAYGRLASAARNGLAFSTFAYDGNGILASATFPGASLTLTLDGLTRAVTGSTLTAGATTSGTTQKMSIRGLVDYETFAAGATSQTRSYTYKVQRFLSTATGYGYDFDPSGLPTSITKGTATKSIVKVGNTLVAGTATYVFDGLGRTTSRTDPAAPATNLTLAYGPDGQVATATKGSTTWSFVYDEGGQRIAKLLAGAPVALYLDEGYVDSSGLAEPVKVAGRTVGLWKGGAFTSLATDLRGSVMAESGALQLASPFGQRDVHPSMAKVIDYVEKGFDADLGFVRMGVRDYDPEINRFTTADPLPLESPDMCLRDASPCNLYGYAAGDPLRLVDPSGKWPFPTHWANTAQAVVRADPQGERFSVHDMLIIMKAQVDADKDQTAQYPHAMRVLDAKTGIPAHSTVEAKGLTVYFAFSQLEKAIEHNRSGRREEALQSLILGGHAIEDQDPWAHKGFQALPPLKWTSLDSLKPWSAHVAKDLGGMMLDQPGQERSVEGLTRYLQIFLDATSKEPKIKPYERFDRVNDLVWLTPDHGK